MRQFDEANAGLAHSPRRQAVSPEVVRRLFANSVRVECGLCFLGHIKQFGQGRWHAESKLVGIQDSI